MEYFHPDYVGWSNRNALPGNKATAAKFISHYHKASKTLVHHVQPVGIKIHGNIAIVHYHWTQISKTADKEDESSGRWTDVLMKQGEKWVLIGDHGGPDPKKN